MTRRPPRHEENGTYGLDLTPTADADLPDGNGTAPTGSMPQSFGWTRWESAGHAAPQADRSPFNGGR